jgi:hypothetical protein
MMLLELASLRAVRRWLVDVADVTPDRIVSSAPTVANTASAPDTRSRT